MRSGRFNAGERQRGAVLIVGLIMLAVMSMFVISMLKTAVMELKIGGASHIFARNLANAEVAVNNFIADNNNRFAYNFLTLPLGAPGAAINVPPVLDYGYGVYSTVVVNPTQIQCGPWAPIGYDLRASSNLQAVYFDVAATSTDVVGGRTRVHQGVEVLIPPGAC